MYALDQAQYSTLIEALEAVPDPRRRRGQRSPWAVLLTLSSGALISGHQHGRAIAQWVREHTEDLRRRLQPPRGRLPSASTLRRALRAVDLPALAAHLAHFTQHLDASK